MEYLLAATVIGAGYVLGQKERQISSANLKDTLNEDETPSQNTIYDSKHLENVKTQELKLANEKFEKSKDAINTNVIPPQFNNRIFNNQTNSIKYLEHPEHTRKNNSRTQHNAFISQLSGQTIVKEDFVHNNMVPFFGGSVKQNTYEQANQPILELYTGTNSNSISKKEMEPMFQPNKEINNVYGTKLATSELLDRYVSSKERKNETPIRPIMVGPGLNNGFTSKPSGGFHQGNTREYIMPKSVDEIRTLNNPKLTFKGRIIAGKDQINKRTTIGKVNKFRPDTFYVSGKDRLFTTVGAVTKEKKRPCIIYKDTKRKVSKSYQGPGAPAVNKGKQIRGKYKIASKHTYKSSGIRNASLKDQWKNEEFNDYGKKNISCNPNERDITGKRTHVTNITSVVKAIVAPVQDILRTTRKQNVIGNIRQTGNFNSSAPSKLTVYDPNDIARATIKETNIHNNRTGYLKGTNKLTVYDPNDVARTTIRQTTGNDVRTANIKGPNRLTIYDPNDIARTTIKETNIHDVRTGQIETTVGTRGTVYDPSNVTRTTIRQTTESDVRTGNIKAPKRTTIYDPNDITRTTIKETNIHDVRTGQMETTVGTRGTIYDPNDIARTTIRQTTEGDVRAANIIGPNRLTVYDPNDIARTTIKETNIHDVRTGQMQRTVGNKGFVIDPVESRARTTIRNTVNSQDTVLNMNGPNKPIVYDPHDVARTTIKETTVDDNHTGNVHTINKSFVYDPSNVARTTIKETTIDEKRIGNINTLEGTNAGGYLTNPKNAKNTNRQFTTGEYTGAMDGVVTTSGGKGYITNKNIAPNTNRQFTSKSYTGGADSKNTKPMSYVDVYNATINEVKEGTLVGREPTPSNVTLTNGMDTINMETRKLEGDSIISRKPNSNKIYSNITQLERCSITQTKDQLDNKKIIDRIEPELLNSFKTNPYAKPLDSHTFN